MEQIFHCTGDEFFQLVAAKFTVSEIDSSGQFNVRKGTFRSVDIKMTESGDELVVKFRPALTALGLFLSIVISILVGRGIALSSVFLVTLYFIQIAHSSQLTWDILQATQSTNTLRTDDN